MGEDLSKLEQRYQGCGMGGGGTKSYKEVEKWYLVKNRWSGSKGWQNWEDNQFKRVDLLWSFFGFLAIQFDTFIVATPRTKTFLELFYSAIHQWIKFYNFNSLNSIIDLLGYSIRYWNSKRYFNCTFFEFLNTFKMMMAVYSRPWNNNISFKLNSNRQIVF